MNLSIATFNIYNYARPSFACYEEDNSYSDVAWRVKEQGLVDIITQANADVLCLQEVFCLEALKNLLMPLGYRYFYHQAEPILQWGYLYLAPINVICTKRAANNVGSLPGFERAPVRIEFDGIEVICVHLKSKRPKVEPNDAAASAQLVGSYVSDNIRHREVERLADRVSNVAQSIAVMGDFNDTQDSNMVKALMTLHQRGEGRFLTRPDIPTHYFGSSGNGIDHIFINRPLMSIWPNYEVVVMDRHLTYQPSYHHQFISDHALVLCKIAT